MGSLLSTLSVVTENSFCYASAMRELTPQAAATEIAAALMRADRDIESARVWTKKGVRIYITEDSGPVGHVEVRAGLGMSAIRGDYFTYRESMRDVVRKLMGDVLVGEPGQRTLQPLEQVAHRIVAELGSRGYNANVWSKKGVRVYIESASGGELGWLEVVGGPSTVENRSRLSKAMIAAVVEATADSKTVGAPADQRGGAELLEEVLHHREDDGLRLVYADWLMEQRDRAARARGELVTLMCSKKPPKRRIAEHIAAHEKTWSELRPLGSKWEYDRGFVETISIDALDYTKIMARIFAVEPMVRVLRLSYCDSKCIEQIVGDPTFARIEELSVQAIPRSPDVLEAGLVALAGSRRATALRVLDLSKLRVRDASIIALAGSTTLAKLEHLNLNGSPLSSAAVAALLATKLPSLASVSFNRCDNQKRAAALRKRFPAPKRAKR